MLVILTTLAMMGHGHNSHLKQHSKFLIVEEKAALAAFFVFN